jgi:hypothetical protein
VYSNQSKPPDVGEFWFLCATLGDAEIQPGIVMVSMMCKSPEYCYIMGRSKYTNKLTAACIKVLHLAHRIPDSEGKAYLLSDGK